MGHSAVYPGTFDPLTIGHFDLIQRAAGIFDRLVVAVAVHSRKRTAFTIEERVEMTRQAVRDFTNVEVAPFDRLLVDFVRMRRIHVVVRGLRAFSDFEYEFQMALTNRKLAPEIETLFLMPKESYSYISSSAVRELAEFGGDARGFVPKAVLPFLRRKFGGGDDH